MNYRGTEKDGKKYFIKQDRAKVTIISDDGVLELEVEDCFGRDKDRHTVYEKDRIFLPKKEFTSDFLGVTFTAKGEEITVKELSQRKGMTRGFLSRIISASKLKPDD